MKKKFIAILFISFLFLTSCEPDKLEGYATYENDTHNFSIRYPENWAMREGFGRDNPEITGSIVVFQSPLQGKTDVFRENVHIFTEELPDTVENVHDYLEYSKANLPDQMTNFEILEEGKETINGVESRKIYFSFEPRMQYLHNLAYIFFINDRGYVISSTSRPETFINFRRTFENISRSIEFN